MIICYDTAMQVLREYWLLIVAGAFLCVSLLVGGYNLWYASGPEYLGAIGNGRVVVDRDKLENAYARIGGAGMIAYAEEESDFYSRSNYHYAGHAVGEVLYLNEGLGSVATCSDAFEYGCLHQALGRAFAEMGAGTLPSLLSRCDSYPTKRERGQCQHGLGHGLIYAAGYDEAKLNDVLGECDAITTERPIPRNDSCHAGVMMEYNQYYMTMEYEDENGRPASEENPFAFCEVLEKEGYRSICVWWAVSWLHGRLYSFDFSDDTFRTLGILCDTVREGGLRSTCFTSIGRSVGVNADLAPERVIELCSTISPDTSLQRLCIERAARMYVLAGKESGSTDICNLVKDDAMLSCRSDG